MVAIDHFNLIGDFKCPHATWLSHMYPNSEVVHNEWIEISNNEMLNLELVIWYQVGPIELLGLNFLQAARKLISIFCEDWGID